VSRVALILSSGRTGTKFLAEYFDANYEGLIARHEPRPSRSLRLASHAHLAGALSQERLLSLLRRKRRRHVDPLRAPLYIESNPLLSGFAGVIHQVWENPIVIHVVRDPREHVRSSLNHGTASGLKGFSNRFIPYWYPDISRILGLADEPSRVGMAAGVWTVMNQRLRTCSQHPDYHLLHYESVFDRSYSGLRELCGILGLEYRDANAPVAPTQRINASRLQVIGPWREWSARDCRELERICQPLMREYGYGNESEWRAKLAEDSPGRAQADSNA
jgi:hypothetical protein